MNSRKSLLAHAIARGSRPISGWCHSGARQEGSNRGRLVVSTHGAVCALLLATGAVKAQESVRLEEVIVTATRQAESIQNVPMVITAISGEEFADNNFTDFSDMAQLSAGIQLAQTSQGPEASIRGVNTVTVSGGPPAVDVYINESPVNATIAFQSLYDIGQIEVLRGPQGTLRGNTAPAGAITISTKRPVINQYSGNFSTRLSKREQFNYETQAALNLPLIQDKLAVRIAGLIGENDGNGAENSLSGIHSENRISSSRLSLAFQPTDRLEIFASYQYMKTVEDSLDRVEGAGMGYNGPPIRGSQNRAVQEATNRLERVTELGELIVRYELDDGTINYILGYRDSQSDIGPGDHEIDEGNAILNLGRLPNAYNYIPVRVWTHELRLDATAADGLIDYTIGAYRATEGTDVRQYYPQIALPGAFGDPATAGGIPSGPLNERYLSYIDLHLYGGDDKVFGEAATSSVFASTTFHLPTDTHVRMGARRIWLTDDKNFVMNIRPSNIATEVPFPTSQCSTIIPGSSASPDYPTSCDIPFQNISVADQHSKRNFSTWIYDLNIRQELTHNLMVYANYSHSWRGPGTSQGNVPLQYVSLEPEKSDNYEIGVKANLFDSRMLITAAVFQQDFKNYNASVSQIPFLSPGNSVEDVYSITYNGDARVRGFEADIHTQISNSWDARLAVSYAKSEFKDAESPCRDSDFDGYPDTGTPTAAQFNAAGVNVATCSNNGPINGLPEWSVNLQSEYVVPMKGAELYMRAIYNWQGDGEIVSANVPIDSYGTLNLYGGTRGMANGSVDVGVYVKNLFDETRRIDQGSLMNFLGAPSGYRKVFYTPGREFGVTFRYSFGSG